MTTAISPSTAAHHGLAAHEVVLLLETDPHRGLTGREAAERLARFGSNTLPAPKGAGLLIRILRQFHHPLIYVLLAAGAITAALGEYVDSAVILGVVLGEIFEQSLRRALSISNGDWGILFHTPSAIVLWILAAAVLFFPSVLARVRRPTPAVAEKEMVGEE